MQHKTTWKKVDHAGNDPHITEPDIGIRAAFFMR